VQGHVQQAQELQPGRLGDLVEAEEQVLAQEGDELQQGDPRVARVVVRPLRVVDGDAADQLVAELLPGAVVQDRCGERHAPHSR
jgi:hypothetical protein